MIPLLTRIQGNVGGLSNITQESLGKDVNVFVVVNSVQATPFCSGQYFSTDLHEDTVAFACWGGVIVLSSSNQSL